jgi:hypothetical protein
VVKYDESYQVPWLILLDGEVIDAFAFEDEARERCAEYNAERA